MYKQIFAQWAIYNIDIKKISTNAKQPQLHKGKTM